MLARSNAKFGMAVNAYDPSGKPEADGEARDLVCTVALIFETCGLDVETSVSIADAG